jgi:RNA polymerase primary sigma factor
MSQSEIHAYLAEVGRYPVLSKEAQLRHCRRIHAWMQAGRDTAPPKLSRAGRRSLEVMTATNLRLVVSIAKRYQGRGMDMADLIQEGNLGLIRGLELFDPTRGYAVSTYVYWWVRQGITRALHTHSRTIRLPINTYEVLTKLQRFIGDYLVRNGRHPTISEIAEHMRIPPERATAILEADIQTACASLDTLCPEGSGTLLDLIPSTSPADDPEHHLLTESDHEAIHTGLGQLQDVERHVITSTYFKDRTLRELGEELGISRARAGQIQQAGIRKLKQMLKASNHTP